MSLEKKTKKGMLIQKKTKQKNSESEEQFTVAFYESPDAMVITTLSDGTVMEINEVFTKLLGYTRTEIVGKKTKQFSIWVHPADRVTFITSLKKTGQITHFETTLRHKNGISLAVIDSARLIKFHGEKCVLSIIHDVTDRKRLESEIAHTNRALRVVSNINQTLIHITDETTFLHEVCRIIVEKGEFCMAWIGFAENDAFKTVRSVSFAGSESGYLKTAKIIWADTAHGHGPTGKAIRTGVTQIIQNISEDRSMLPWKDLAKKKGFLSSIALPIKIGATVVGTLNIYANVINAFTGEEIKILQELASDIAFGISYYRERVVQLNIKEELEEAQRIGHFGNFDWDARTDKINWSDEYYRIYGIEIGTKPPGYVEHLKLYTPETAARLDAAVQKSMKTGEPYEVELERVRPDGLRQWIIARGEVKHDENEKIIGLRGTAQDVTKEKKMSEKDRFYALVMEASVDAIIGKTLDGIVTTWNHGAEEMYGYSAKEMIGKSITIIVPDEMRKEYVELMSLVKKGEYVKRYETVRVTKDGRRLTVFISLSPVFDKNGKIFAVSLISHDMSKYIENENKIRELSEIRSKFIDIISHQLRTPLTAVNWNLEMLLNGEYGKMDETQHKFLEITHSASLEITHRIHNLLTAMDVEEGRTRYVSEDIAMNSLCAAVVSEKMSKAELKTLSFTYTQPEKDIPPVFGDAEKIRLVVSELIENAIDYTKDHGKVAVVLQQKKGIVRFEVIDTGIGVPIAEQHLLFTRFFRASNASVMKPDGFGLGLYLTKNFIEQHQGKTGFESTEGKGSTFWFEVPLKKQWEIKK